MRLRLLTMMLILLSSTVLIAEEIDDQEVVEEKSSTLVGVGEEGSAVYSGEQQIPVDDESDDLQDTADWAEENAIRLDDIEDQMDIVERSTLVDRLDFSADVRMTLNNFFYIDRSREEVKDQGLLIEDGNTLALFNMRARIKMVSRLSDSLKITSWLTMYKQFLESAPDRYQNPLPTYDSAYVRYPGNSTVYMERLYLDWFMLDWLSLTLGRLPSLDGMPNDIQNNTVSLGTVPASNLNAIIDGVFLSANLDRFTALKKFDVRFLYIPRLMVDDSFSVSNMFVPSPSNNQHAAGISISFELPKIPDSMLFLTANQIFGFKARVKADVDEDGVDEVMTEPDSLGSLTVLYSGLFLYKFLGSPFDLYGSFQYELWQHPIRTEDNPNEGIVGLPEENNDIPTSPAATLFGKAPNGQLSDGYQVNAGMRYTTPIRLFHDYVKIGGDFTYSTGNYFMYFTPDTTGLDKYGMIGTSAEGYLIIPLHRKAHLKLGYIYQHHTHVWGMAFAPSEEGVPEIDETIHNPYMMLNVYF